MKLKPISYTVLVLVGCGGAGAHDLVRMRRQGRIYSSFAESQYYAEAKRLAKAGLLEAHAEPGRTRERTVYRITAAGVEALRAWLDDPPAAPTLPSDAIVRLLAADIVGEKRVKRNLLQLRGELADLRGRLDVAEAVAETLPHRRKYLLLNHRLARRIVDAYEEWVAEIDRELKG